MLKEPITGASVIVVERKKLENLIEKNLLNNIEKILAGKYENIDSENISRFRLIPFSSLGKQNGMLLGFKPDMVKVIFDESEKNLGNVVIGIYDKEITKNQEYTGLVGLDILEEGSKFRNEYIRNIKT